MKYSAQLTAAFYSFLFFCTLLHASHFLNYTYNSPIDFRNVYLGARCWFQGENAYDDAVLKQEWQQVCEHEQLENTLPPGLPQNSLVYPPSAFPVYWVLALLPWKWAAILNLLFSCVALVLIVWLARNYFDLTRVPFGLLLLVVCAFKGTFHALLVGQPTFLFMLLALSSLYFLNQHRHRIAAVMLGISMCKPTLVLPFVLYLLVKRQYKPVFFASLLQLSLAGIAFLFFKQPMVLIDGFSANINALMDMVYVQGNIYYMRTLTDLGVWVNYLFNNSYSLWKTVQNILLVAGAFLFWYKPPHNKLVLFSAIALITLLLSYHLFYDVLILIPLIGLITSSSMNYKIMAACLALPLFLPVNGLLDRTAAGELFPLLYLHLPIVLLALAGWLVAYLRLNHR